MQMCFELPAPARRSCFLTTPDGRPLCSPSPHVLAPDVTRTMTPISGLGMLVCTSGSSIPPARPVSRRHTFASLPDTTRLTPCRSSISLFRYIAAPNGRNLPLAET